MAEDSRKVWAGVAPARVVEVAQRLIALPWPVPAEPEEDLFRAFGWELVAPRTRTFRTGLGVSPDFVTASAVEGYVGYVRVNLVDRYRGEYSEERDDFIQDTRGSYVLALKDVFGDSRRAPVSRERAASYWDRENGCRLTLESSLPMITLMVESPRVAAARRVLERFPGDD